MICRLIKVNYNITFITVIIAIILRSCLFSSFPFYTQERLIDLDSCVLQSSTIHIHLPANVSIADFLISSATTFSLLFVSFSPFLSPFLSLGQFEHLSDTCECLAEVEQAHYILLLFLIYTFMCCTDFTILFYFSG